MSADETLGTPGTMTAPAAPAAPASSTVPDDYEELRAFREQYQPVLANIAEHWDDIRPLIEDEQEREFYHSARETRKEYLERQKPQIPAEFQPVVDRFEKELTPLVEYVRSEQTTREQEKQRHIQEAQQANVAFANRLAAERPDLVDDNYAGMYMLASFANARGMSLEEAWKSKGGSFTAPAPKSEPPRSLRGGQAAPGVPGESSLPPIKGPRDLKNRLAANMRAAMKG